MNRFSTELTFCEGNFPAQLAVFLKVDHDPGENFSNEGTCRLICLRHADSSKELFGREHSLNLKIGKHFSIKFQKILGKQNIQKLN